MKVLQISFKRQKNRKSAQYIIIHTYLLTVEKKIPIKKHSNKWLTIPLYAIVFVHILHAKSRYRAEEKSNLFDTGKNASIYDYAKDVQSRKNL